jgi:hypothetical protein
MTIDPSSSRTALEVLRVVSTHNGSWTWYNITTRVDQIEGIEKDPPVFHVIKNLVAGGLLRTEPPEGGNAAVYFLTKQGEDIIRHVQKL